MTEDLAALETRLRRLHAQHVAEAPKLVKDMDANELRAFEIEHGLRYRGGPVPMTKQPPGHTRSNIFPPPVPVPEGKSVFDMTEAEVRAFEVQHGLFSMMTRNAY